LSVAKRSEFASLNFYVWFTSQNLELEIRFKYLFEHIWLDLLHFILLLSISGPAIPFPLQICKGDINFCNFNLPKSIVY